MADPDLQSTPHTRPLTPEKQQAIADATGMTFIGVGNALRFRQFGYADERICAHAFTGAVGLALQLIDAEIGGSDA